MLTSFVVAGPPQINQVDQNINGHTLLCYEAGTRNNNPNDLRAKRSDCRNCPNLGRNGSRFSRQTSFYCSQCLVGLHPECFSAYHSTERTGRHVAAEKRKVQITPVVQARRANVIRRARREETL